MQDRSKQEKGKEKESLLENSHYSSGEYSEDHRDNPFNDLPSELILEIATHLVPHRSRLKDKHLLELAAFAQVDKRTHTITEAVPIQVQQNDERVSLGTYGEIRKMLNRPAVIEREIKELTENSCYQAMNQLQNGPCFFPATISAFMCVVGPSLGLSLALAFTLKGVVPAAAMLSTSVGSGVMTGTAGVGTILFFTSMPDRTRNKIEKLREEQVPSPLTMRK